MRSWKASLTATALFVVVNAGTAAAGGFAVREQSAEGQGASFAGVAAGLSHQLLDWIIINFAYTHIFFEDGDVALPGALSASFEQSADSVALSATLDW